MLIDTHAHLNFNAFKDDTDEVIKRSLENNVWMINVGSQYATSKRAVEIAEKYSEGVFAAIGLHPIHLETGLVKIKNDEEETEVKTSEEDFDYQDYKALAESKRVAAIGEIGLDYYWKPKTKKKLVLFKEKQREVLSKQMNLAGELNLPIIFHCRMAHENLINILNTRYEIQNTNIRGVVHCFTGNLEQAKKYLEIGLYLGFNGIVFKKIEGISFEEVIQYAPLDRILIETDCPYLTPPPIAGRNEPIYIKYIAERISQIKNLSFKKIAEITTENARNLFRI